MSWPRRNVPLEELLRELGRAANITTTCAYCPTWRWTGPPEEARRRFEAHERGARHVRRAEAAKAGS